ncbi:MAG: hypothetical protein ACRDNK_18940 [Solirubrobacteraceae bacterium]
MTRISRLAARLRITERAVQRIVSDLISAVLLSSTASEERRDEMATGV